MIYKLGSWRWCSLPISAEWLSLIPSIISCFQIPATADPRRHQMTPSPFRSLPLTVEACKWEAPGFDLSKAWLLQALGSLQISKSKDARVPYIKWQRIAHILCISSSISQTIPWLLAAILHKCYVNHCCTEMLRVWTSEQNSVHTQHRYMLFLNISDMQLVESLDTQSLAEELQDTKRCPCLKI